MKKKSIGIIINVLLIINIIFFIFEFNTLVFINKIIPFIGNLLLLILVTFQIYLLYKIINNIKTKKIIYIITLFLNIIIFILNISANIFDKFMSNLTDNEEIYTSTIIVRTDSNITSTNDLVNVNIGQSSDKLDYENYKLGHDYLEKHNKLQNNFYDYNDYKLAISDLLNGNIDALIISGDYLNLYDEYFENLDSKVRPIIDNLEYSVKIDSNKTKDQSEPFTMLVIGADGDGGATYNADVLILMTVNPNTKKVVMVDVVRDTYALNLGNNKMDKITHSGWYGTQNVADTVGNLFDIKIDYYIRMNFNSVIDFIDLMGGIDIDVPYKINVKNGKTSYYVDKGYRHLNGTETLALARTRKMPGSSLYTRGRMQMNIIEQTIKQMDRNFIINNFFTTFNLISDNVVTNISKQDLYYYIQKYIDIKDKLVFSENSLNGSDSQYYHEGMKQYLYTYKVDENSLNEMKTLLKDNLK